MDFVSANIFGTISGDLGCVNGFFMEAGAYAKMWSTYKDVYAEDQLYVQYNKLHPDATRNDFELLKLGNKIDNLVSHPAYCDAAEIEFATVGLVATPAVVAGGGEVIGWTLWAIGNGGTVISWSLCR
jgi:hypothetical protein